MQNETMEFTVALLQISPLGNNQSGNLAKAPHYCRAAKAPGADLAVFPELWNIGFNPSPTDSGGRQLWMNSAIDQWSTFFQSFAALARELDRHAWVISWLKSKTNPPPAFLLPNVFHARKA
jgi:predicted amidohydrolase